MKRKRACILLTVIVMVAVASATVSTEDIEKKEKGIYKKEKCITTTYQERQCVQTEQSTEAKEDIFTPIKDVDLPANLQKVIFDFSYDNDISPYIVFAIAKRESNYKPNLIGDDGQAYGMMQIHIRYCKDIMDSLGIQEDAVFEPYNNACIGIKILKKLFEKHEDVYWVLMAYNGGEAYADDNINATDYAKEVAEYAYELEKSHGAIYNTPCDKSIPFRTN